MCGIAGVFGKSDHQTVQAMLDRLTHRGPDDEYIVSGDQFTLGARRLSIVGIEDGRQPLSNETHTIWAAQNGELYNYPTVKQQLSRQGHEFQTCCDTEMLPHLYEEFGNDLVQHIDGMFAVAVWDDVKKIGLLARDRMGKKPLFYHETADAIYFASEIKSLLCIPGFQRKINFEALNHFLSYKHIPCPLSIFAGINLLPPAHRLIFRPGEASQIQRYWDLDFSHNQALEGCTEEELSEQLVQLLRQGVKRRLMSDVPIGFFLSGGIDSSLSTAIAAEVSPDPIKTFTLIYANNSTTAGKELDRKWANWTAQKYGTEHHEEEIAFSHFPDSLRQIIGCFDEPFAGTMSTYFLSALIAKHVKVAVSGDGADELFGSYLSHRLAFPLSQYANYSATDNANLIAPFQAQPDLLKRLHEPEDWSWRSKLFVYSEAEKAQLFSKEVAATMSRYDSRERLRQDFSQLSASDPLNRILEAEYRTIFPDQVLTFVDRLSMAHSLEVRSVYLDTDVVTFAAGLPGNLKIKNGETKYLLKQAALKFFPEDMVFRKKEGFLMPITEWILGDLEDYVRSTLSPTRLSQHNIFDTKQVKALVDQLYTQQCDYTHVNKVFSLLVFQEWYELYMT